MYHEYITNQAKKVNDLDGGTITSGEVWCRVAVESYVILRNLVEIGIRMSRNLGFMERWFVSNC